MSIHETALLPKRWESFRDGGPEAMQELLALVYPELRRRAKVLMISERSTHTLQATAVVHEAFLRLFNNPEIWWENSAHFLFAISREMRHILTEYARRRLRDKRGGKVLRVGLEEVQIEDAAASRTEEAVAVGEAMDELDRLDSRAAKVVELRFFAGLTVEETAAVLRISERTVREVWSFARVWLKDYLQEA